MAAKTPAVPQGIPPPPLGRGSNNVVECRWEFSTDHGSGHIGILTEGVGHFVELGTSSDDPLKLDVEEFLALAQWAVAAVAAMDAATGEVANDHATR